LGNFARALHHLDIKDVKRKRLEEIAAKKIKEQQDIKEKKIIKEISKKYKSDWKREIYEGMTTTNSLTMTLPADFEQVFNDTPTTDAEAFADAPARGSEVVYGAMVGTNVKSSGSGTGSDGGFDIGDHIAFDETGNEGARWCVLKPVDTTRVDFMTVRAIVGNGSNGGETPDDANEGLILYYKTSDMFDYIPINYYPTLTGAHAKGGSNTIIPLNIGSYGDTLRDYFVQIPEYARTKDTRFLLYQVDSSGLNRDTYGITNVSYRRFTPLNVVVPLDDPEAVSFVRVGTDEGDPKKRKKKLNDQLAASDEYTASVLGDQFPGQGARVDGDDPFRSAPLTPDDVIQASPIGKGEVKKSFSSFSADSATSDPEPTEPELTAPSAQATMAPTTDDGDPINVKTVGGKNSGAVQGADAAAVDAQNAQDDAQEPETTEPETTEPEAIDPDDIKPDPDETKDKTPEEVKKIEKQKFNDQFDKQTNFFKEQMIEQIDKLNDLPVDKFVDFSVGIIKVLRGINQAGAVLAKLGGLIGGLSDEQNEILKYFETKQLGWEKLMNGANIFRSTLTGRIEAQDYSPFQIGKLTKNLNPAQFMGENFYLEDSGNFGISDTRHEYADDNIYVLNGKVYNNTDGNRKGVYATPLANMGVFTPEIDGIGRGYGQMIIPKDGSAPYFHYYDYNYYNMNSTDSGEVPDKFQQFMADLAGTVRKVLPGRLFNDVVNRFEGNLNTFNNNLKERVGLDGWPPGIHGATLHDFKIPLSDLSQEMQDMIAAHPLSWTPERMANMSEDEIYEQFYSLENLDYDDYSEYMSDITRMPTEPVNTVPFAVAMQDIDKIYLEEYEPISDEFQKNQEKGYNESPFTEAERAAYDDLQTAKAQMEKESDENNRLRGTQVQLDLWDKLVKPAYDAFVKATKNGSVSGNSPIKKRLDKQHAKWKKQSDKMEAEAARVQKEYLEKYYEQVDRISEYVNAQGVSNSIEGFEGYATTSDEKGRGDYTTLDGRVITSRFNLVKSHVDITREIQGRMMELYEPVADLKKYVDGNYVREAKIKEFGEKHKTISGESWTPKKKGSGKTSTPDKPKPKPKPRSGSGSIAGLDEPLVIDKNKKNKNEEVILKCARPQPNRDLFERLKQKQFFNPNDIKPVFPENPPPQLDPKTGMHPNYGKNAKRFGKLDPASANSMPPTGDPETDAVVDKQRTKPKPKLYDKLKKNIRKDLTNK